MSAKSPVSPRRTLQWVVSCVILGAAVIVIGLIMIFIPAGSASFGWFAYVPGSDVVFSPAGALLAPLHQIGLIVGVLGLVVLAFGTGWWLGLRPSRLSRARGTSPR
jgi:ABC-type Na+ efflux pump permease subunit